MAWRFILSLLNQCEASACCILDLVTSVGSSRDIELVARERSEPLVQLSLLET